MSTDKFNSTQELGVTLLRIALGVMFLAHAGLKVFTFGMDGTVQFFTSVGFPAWTAYAVVAAESMAGALLILGLHTRWVSLAMLPVLLGAASVHWGNGWVFNAPNGGWEYPAFLAVASVVQALLGDGAWALRWKPAAPVGAQPRFQ